MKYQRIGHLFQDRFKSEPVEDDSYFLIVLRYIHQNPVKAGICEKVIEYKYSSYREYTSNSQIADTDFAFKMISKNEFEHYTSEKNSDKCLEIENHQKIRVTDEQAKRIIENISGCNNIAEFQKLDIKYRDKFITNFKEKGLSIRQISRLTGISFAIVRKI